MTNVEERLGRMADGSQERRRLVWARSVAPI
jgi:hypothetical protein